MGLEYLAGTIFYAEDPEFDIDDRAYCLCNGEFEILDITEKKRLPPEDVKNRFFAKFFTKVFLREWHYSGWMYECVINPETSNMQQGKFLGFTKNPVPEVALIPMSLINKINNIEKDLP